jgi:hypothetical protein
MKAGAASLAKGSSKDDDFAAGRPLCSMAHHNRYAVTVSHQQISY